MKRRLSPWQLAVMAIVSVLVAIPSRTIASVWRNYDDESTQELRYEESEATDGLRVLERKRINRSYGLVRRKGDALEFKLTNGKYIKLSDVMLKPDDSNSDVCKSYYFIKYDNRIDYFVVYSSFCFDHHTEDPFTIINRRSGLMYQIQEFPNVSPDYKRICTIDMGDGFNTNEMQILMVNKDHIAKEYSYRPKELWLNADVEWIDSKTIKVTREVASDSKVDYRGNKVWVTRTSFFTLTQRGWVLTD